MTLLMEQEQVKRSSKLKKKKKAQDAWIRSISASGGELQRSAVFLSFTRLKDMLGYENVLSHKHDGGKKGRLSERM